MDNKDIILIVLIVIFLICVLLFAIFFQILFAKFWARSHGLNLTFAQSKILSKSYCLKKHFLKNVKLIWDIEKIPIDKLVDHYYAGGNLENIYKGMSQLKSKNREIDFQLITGIDLAGKDLEIEIKKAENNNWIFNLTE